MPKKNPKYTPELIEKLIDMADSDIPYKEIAKQLDISRDMVSYVATTNGIRRYRTVRSFNEHR